MQQKENKGSLTGRINENLRYYFITPFSGLKKARKGNIYKEMSASLANGNNAIYRGLFAWLFLFLLVFMPAISFDFGRNSDETVSNNYGKDILNYYLSGGADRSILDQNKQGYNHMIYYGLSFDFLCAVVNRYISPFGEFETRHLLNALFGLLAIFFAAMTAKKIAGYRTALLVLIFMAATPTFFGHSMNNAKDIPFATGYIMSIFFITKILLEFPKISIKTAVFLVIAIGWTGSNKINGWFMLTAYLLFFTGLSWIFYALRNKGISFEKSGLNQQILPLAAIIVISYFLSIAFWPYAYSGIFTKPLESIKTFENVGRLMIHYELFEGRLMNMADVPWYYTFKFLLITLPLFVIGGFLISVFCIRWLSGRFNINILGMLFFVTLIPVLYAMYKHAKLYNGWRHFLFIYPSFAVIAAVGWEFVLQLNVRKYFRPVISGILVLLIVKTIGWEVRNHPGQVGYFNELTGGTKGAYGYYEIDPQSTLGRKAINWLVSNEIKPGSRVTIITDIEGGSLEYYAKEQGADIRFIWTKGLNTSSNPWDYMILNCSGMSHKQLVSGYFPPKGTLHTVSISGVPVIAVVKRMNDFKILGYRLFNQKNTDSALYYYRKALEYDSNDLEAMDMISATLINMKRYNEALIFLNKSLNIFPENHFAWENVGAIYMFKEDYGKAIRYLRKAVEYRINAKTALLNLGKSYFNAGNLDSSLYYFTEYDKYYPRDADVFLLVAEVFKRKGDMDQALQVYNKVLVLRPNDPNIRSLRDEILSAGMETAYSNEFRLAMSYARQGKLDSTIAILSRVIRSDRGNYTAWLNRGVAWFQAGNMKLAVADLDTAIKIKPAFADAWLKKGQVYLTLKDYKTALELLNTAAKLAPQNWEIFQERGNTLFNLGNFEGAYNDYSNSIRLKPDNTRGYYARGIASMNIGYLDNALADLNKTIELEPGYLDAYNTRALVLYNLKKYREAYNDIQVLKKNGKPVDPNLENNVLNNIK